MHPGEFHTTNKKLHWNNYETRGLSSSNMDLLNFDPSTNISPSSVMEGDISSGLFYSNNNGMQIDPSREYLVLKLPKPVVNKNLNRHRCMFWREKLPMLGRRFLPSKRLQLLPDIFS